MKWTESLNVINQLKLLIWSRAELYKIRFILSWCFCLSEHSNNVMNYQIYEIESVACVIKESWQNLIGVNHM